MNEKRISPSATTLGSPLAFLRSVKVELDLVKWPNRQEALRLTYTVIIGSVLVGLYIGALDYFLTQILTQIITK